MNEGLKFQGFQTVEGPHDFRRQRSLSTATEKYVILGSCKRAILFGIPAFISLEKNPPFSYLSPSWTPSLSSVFLSSSILERESEGGRYAGEDEGERRREKSISPVDHSSLHC